MSKVQDAGQVDLWTILVLDSGGRERRGYDVPLCMLEQMRERVAEMLLGGERLEVLTREEYDRREWERLFGEMVR